MTKIVEEDLGSGAKRWLGYTCPECFAIFRVPVETQGKVASCPHCELPVLLGRRGQSELKEAVPEKSADEGLLEDGWEGSERSGRLEKRKRIKKNRGAKSPKWDGSGDEPQEREGPLFLLVVLVGLLFLTAGVGVFVKGVLESMNDAAVLQGLPGIKIAELKMTDEGDPAVLPQDFNIDAELVVVIEAVGNFLNAGDVDEMLKYVRERPRVGKQVRNYYSAGLFRSTKFRKIGISGGLQLKGSLVTVTVELEDFSERPIALERTADGYLVDWESWVGWGELSWDEFQTTRSTRPTLMRVSVINVEYYNFAFSDDRKWQSYRLEDASGERSFFGYAPKGSLQASRMIAVGKEDESRSMIVRLRYPEKAMRRDQVIIDEVIAHGWISPKVKTPSNP